MNLPISAPFGYLALATFCNGTRSYRIHVRPSSGQWWTDVGLVGHSESLLEEIERDARPLIDQWINLGMVK